MRSRNQAFKADLVIGFSALPGRKDAPTRRHKKKKDREVVRFRRLSGKESGGRSFIHRDKWSCQRTVCDVLHALAKHCLPMRERERCRIKRSSAKRRDTVNHLSMKLEEKLPNGRVAILLRGRIEKHFGSSHKKKKKKKDPPWVYLQKGKRSPMAT